MKKSNIKSSGEIPEVIIQIKDPKNGVIPNLELSSRNPGNVYCMIYHFGDEIDVCFYKNGLSDQILNIKKGTKTDK